MDKLNLVEHTGNRHAPDDTEENPAAMQSQRAKRERRVGAGYQHKRHHL